MTRIADVCDLVRSKNAGPFWITIDLFFDGPDMFARYGRSPNLNVRTFARHYEVDAAQIRLFFVESLALLKISFPRRTPQGGMMERDLHGGQQFVRLLDLELDGVRDPPHVRSLQGRRADAMSETKDRPD